MTLTYPGPVMTAKTGKPVTSTSFAAIAAGNDGFGMIPTGPPPASAIKASISSSKPSVPMPMGKMGGKKDEAVPPLMPASTSSAMDSKDYSPFKTFKMPGSFVNWGAEKPDQFKGFASPTVSSGGGEDQSKAPGFRTSQAGLGSPENVPPTTTVTTTSTSAAGFKKTGAGAGSQPMAEPLFPTQERCNSAPGTPVSPLVPSPIAPPIQAAPNKTANSSPGSEPDYSRWQATGGTGTGMGRATTPEGGADWGERLAREELE